MPAGPDTSGDQAFYGEPTAEVIKLDEVSVTMLWDNHTWGQFYYDSPFVWETMVKLPKLQLVKRH